jgi:ribosomal protein S18 acetylase RimI-like enzyme
MNNVLIRQTVRDDGPRLRELRLEGMRLNPIALTADLTDTESWPAERWEEIAELGGFGKTPQALFVAEAGGELMGMTGIWIPPQPKLAHSAAIWGVYVREAARGRGIGQMLVTAVLDWARARKLVTVRLSVAATSHSAKRCYERCGFTVYGVEPMAVQVDGQFYDEFLMVYRLR